MKRRCGSPWIGGVDIDLSNAGFGRRNAASSARSAGWLPRLNTIKIKLRRCYSLTLHHCFGPTITLADRQSTHSHPSKELVLRVKRLLMEALQIKVTRDRSPIGLRQRTAHDLPLNCRRKSLMTTCEEHVERRGSTRKLCEGEPTDS